ncbi:hypothetical protein [Aquimarina agarivorans]|uniref:hypothetical protein n=1 Tax=Aquimarina agarivorans TaxID=980584 RepID=UPI000248FAFA|nr:hypothetical protein [Aquimarina agarivorans]
MIFVFKTSISSKKTIKLLTPHLNKLLAVSDWNFDLEDCDNILRINSQINIVKKTIEILNDIGFECEELPE